MPFSACASNSPSSSTHANPNHGYLEYLLLPSVFIRWRSFLLSSCDSTGFCIVSEHCCRNSHIKGLFAPAHQCFQESFLALLGVKLSACFWDPSSSGCLWFQVWLVLSERVPQEPAPPPLRTRPHLTFAPMPLGWPAPRYWHLCSGRYSWSFLSHKEK